MLTCLAELDLKYFVTLAEWLRQHINGTSSDQSVWLQRYQNDRCFWDKLSELFWHLTTRK